jgi:ribosomal protein S18 acetylase RimI-like enzyme
MTDPMGACDTGLNKLQQLRLVDALANHSNALVVFLIYDELIVGYAVGFFNISTFFARTMLNIHDFFIDSAQRSHGLGTELMMHLVDIASKRKCCKITLEVREDNEIAMKIYKAIGFCPTTPTYHFWTKILD